MGKINPKDVEFILPSLVSLSRTDFVSRINFYTQIFCSTLFHINISKHKSILNNQLFPRITKYIQKGLGLGRQIYFKYDLKELPNAQMNWILQD
jgi:hypothetical protein